MVGVLRLIPGIFIGASIVRRKDAEGISSLKTRNGSQEVVLPNRNPRKQMNSIVSSRMCSLKLNTISSLLDRSATFNEKRAVIKEGVTKLVKGFNPSKALGPDEFHPSPKGIGNRISSGICPPFPAVN